LSLLIGMVQKMLQVRLPGLENQYTFINILKNRPKIRWLYSGECDEERIMNDSMTISFRGFRTRPKGRRNTSFASSFSFILKTV
jgi:hypothetical protein